MPLKVETTLGGEERADVETEEEEDEEEPRVADSRHQLDPIGEEDISSRLVTNSFCC